MLFKLIILASLCHLIHSLRLPFIAGNWKMNLDLKNAILLANDLVKLTKDMDSKKVEVAIFVPYPYIRDITKIVQGTPIKVGAQNVYFGSNIIFFIIC